GVAVTGVREGGLAALLRRDGVALRELVLPERDGEVARRGEARPDRRRGERMDPTPLFPQIERRRGQLGAGLAVRRHAIGAGPHELAVQRADDLDVAVAAVVLPERPAGQSGLVLLDRQLEPTVGCRRSVPAGAGRAAWGGARGTSP